MGRKAILVRRWQSFSMLAKECYNHWVMEEKRIETREDVERLLELARERFLVRDASLLDINVNERSLTHKFAEYIQSIVGDNWNVDCEYNRFGTEPKIIHEIQNIINGESAPIDDLTAKTVFPDIIIHKRGPEGPNRVVIEAKKNATQDDRKKDMRKLHAIMEMYNYAFTVFIDFKTRDKSIKWEIEENNK